MKKIVVLTGAGMSAESGLKTFREMGGLWEEYDVYEVASPGGWAKDRAMVLRFYNERRKQLLRSGRIPLRAGGDPAWGLLTSRPWDLFAWIAVCGSRGRAAVAGRRRTASEAARPAFDCGP